MRHSRRDFLDGSSKRSVGAELPRESLSHLRYRRVSEPPENLSYLAVGHPRVLPHEVDCHLSRQASILKKLLLGKPKMPAYRLNHSFPSPTTKIYFFKCPVIGLREEDPLSPISASGHVVEGPPILDP
jgi:hypothetical protein